jgi:hypothetical protein
LTMASTAKAVISVLRISIFSIIGPLPPWFPLT